MSEKKMTLQEAIKQKLESKKQAQANGQAGAKGSNQTKSMKSQVSKKTNNQRRRMGV
ncbi:MULTISPECIES: hypothetical protein [Metabacillus]|uniref:hypothetical protein n=1 Tax=Metabacillus TaxID=2675233 RepID=UPI000AD3E565|nr:MULTISPECIES: hypothetical protein [Metabacillus]MDX8289788.1 hypothetical protein [Metabacillus indicus]